MFKVGKEVKLKSNFLLCVSDGHLAMVGLAKWLMLQSKEGVHGGNMKDKVLQELNAFLFSSIL
jgi:hypothetical protein